MIRYRVVNAWQRNSPRLRKKRKDNIKEEKKKTRVPTTYCSFPATFHALFLFWALFMCPLSPYTHPNSVISHLIAYGSFSLKVRLQFFSPTLLGNAAPSIRLNVYRLRFCYLFISAPVFASFNFVPRNEKTLPYVSRQVLFKLSTLAGAESRSPL